MGLINYAEALEDDGTYGEVAKNAWRKAADGWHEFGAREMPTTYNRTSISTTASVPRERSRRRDGTRQARAVPAKRSAAKKSPPCPEDREILEKSRAERSPREATRHPRCSGQSKPDYHAIAERAEHDHRLEVLLAETRRVGREHGRYHRPLSRDRQLRLLAQARATWNKRPMPWMPAGYSIEADRCFAARQPGAAPVKYEESLVKFAQCSTRFPASRRKTVFVDDLNDTSSIIAKSLRQLTGSSQTTSPLRISPGQRRQRRPGPGEPLDVTADPPSRRPAANPRCRQVPKHRPPRPVRKTPPPKTQS